MHEEESSGHQLILGICTLCASLAVILVSLLCLSTQSWKNHDNNVYKKEGA